MAAEASRVLARRGVDAPSFRMVAFGGAGPLMAALLADEIDIDAILIPPVPGALSVSVRKVHESFESVTGWGLSGSNRL